MSTRMLALNLLIVILLSFVSATEVLPSIVLTAPGVSSSPSSAGAASSSFSSSSSFCSFFAFCYHAFQEEVSLLHSSRERRASQERRGAHTFAAGFFSFLTVVAFLIFPVP